MKTRFQEDIDALMAAHPNARIWLLPDGRTAVELTGHPLPPGWTQPTTTVLWLLDPGYPTVKPDCFWIDVEARSPPGTNQVNTQIQEALPGSGQMRRWVSWHIEWRPAVHDLHDWLNSINRSLREATGRVP
jgi:hypothetical protein